MHSRPFTSPSPREDGLSSTCVPSHGSLRRTDIIPIDDDDDDEVASFTCRSDPETTRLLVPRRRRRHRVRIQGRLASVRMVTVASPRRARIDDSETGDDDNDDDDDDDECDVQFRGYGIGGAGNIRRPTDIMGARSSASQSLLSLIHISSSSPPTPTPDAASPGRLRWRMASLFRDLGGYRGKSKAAAAAG